MGAHPTLATQCVPGIDSGDDPPSLSRRRMSVKNPRHDQVQDENWSRREVLRQGLVGSFGLNLASLIWARQSVAGQTTPSAAAAAAKIRACIIVFYYGGPSHIDTFDPKPDAPKETRGEFQTISTSVPGLAICEHLPHM